MTTRLKTNITRRHFGALLGAGAATLAMPAYLRAQGRPRVVVVGGGPGGATAARYIAKDSNGEIDVTLIDANESFTTCFFSNLYLGDFQSFDDITHNWDQLVANHGINKITAYATGVDRAAKTVSLHNGETVEYDRLVLSPGIDIVYDSVPGYSQDVAEIAPHAWQAGRQTQILKEKLDALEDGQHIVMVAPPNPYRCPPGPYERVSMFAHVLKRKGFENSRIYVIDPKPSFSKQALFEEGWARHYPGMIEWYGPDIHGGIVNVDAEAGTVETDFDTFEGALLNIIPAQRAGAIAHEAGLTNEAGWVPIDPFTMRSQEDEEIYVLGDATVAGDMPKSGFSANSQAKVAAMNIRGELTDANVFPARYANTCWSLIETNDGVKVGAQYQPTEEKIESVSSFISQTGESDELRQETYEESLGWYDGIIEDMFS